MSALDPELIYSLWSVKRLWVFLLNLDGMLVYLRSLPSPSPPPPWATSSIKFAGIHLYTCIHCHIVGTRTYYLSRLPAPTRSMLFTNRKSANSQGVRTNHGRSQDFSKGGSHWLIQRVLIRLSPEYCKLFAYKKAYKGGVTGTPGPPPLATPMGQTVLSKTEWGKGGVCGPTIYESGCGWKEALWE